MSFLDWLTGKIECPRCGTRGAKEINGCIRCPNPTCEYFNTAMDKSGVAPTLTTFSSPGEVPPGYVAIQYRNFRGQGKTFVAKAASARRRNNHISVVVEPKRLRIALARDRIANLNEVEAVLPQRAEAGQPQPTPRERMVMMYHKNRGSTSPLYESLRAKYPNW